MYTYHNQGFVHNPDAFMQFMFLALENELTGGMFLCNVKSIYEKKQLFTKGQLIL